MNINTREVRGCKCTCGSFHVGASDASQLTISDVAENILGKGKTSYSNCANFHDPNVVSFFFFLFSFLFFPPSILMDEVEVGLLLSCFQI